MGYHIRIVRTEKAQSVPILRGEFATAVRAIATLDLDVDETTARFVKKGELRSTLSLSDGEVWTNNAEEDVLAVMIELAGRLKARVRGDEGETYRSIAESYQHPDDSDQPRSDGIGDKPKRRWLWNAVRLLILLVVIGLIIANTLRK